MKEKKSPQRMCIACRTMRDKRELIRIVKSPEGVISLDFTGKKNGRGADVWPSEACINKCRKANLLYRACSSQVDDEVYDNLIKELKLENG